MSKAALKKELQKLTKEHLIEHILDLYDKNKSVKEFYDFHLHPLNERDLAEKYKKVIRKEFDVESPQILNSTKSSFTPLQTATSVWMFTSRARPFGLKNVKPC